MPRITHYQVSRNVDYDTAPTEIRLKMIRNHIKFVIVPTDQDADGVTDIFDDLDTSLHEHTTELFHMYTKLAYPDDSYENRERFLQVTMYFEDRSDMERVQKNVIVPLKLSL